MIAQPCIEIMILEWQTISIAVGSSNRLLVMCKLRLSVFFIPSKE